MNYEPPDGIANFVRVLQRASPEDAADVLRLAFENAAASALVDDLRLRRAAPALLAACKLALRAFEGDVIDWTAVLSAVDAAEREGTNAG